MKNQPTQPHITQRGRPTSTTTLPKLSLELHRQDLFPLSPIKLYAGRISDNGILTLLDEGDVVLADKDVDITEEVAAVKAELLSKN